LLPEGHTQAEALATQWSLGSPDRVVVSPCRRTEGIVGQEVQLEALAGGAGLDEAGLSAGSASIGRR